MRFSKGEFSGLIPAPLKAWDQHIIPSPDLESSLAQSGSFSADFELLNSTASAGLTLWVDLERALGQNMGHGVQITGGVLDALEGAAGEDWNMGGSGVVGSIFAGTGDLLETAIDSVNQNGIDAEIMAKQLGKAAIGIAIGALTAANPAIGAVAGVIAFGVRFAMEEFKRASEADYMPITAVMGLSGATATNCNAASAMAADSYMMRMISGVGGLDILAGAQGVNGIPSDTGQLEKAAAFTDLTQLFLPGPIPTGRTSPEIKWYPCTGSQDPQFNAPDGCFEFLEGYPGYSDHPMATGKSLGDGGFGQLREINHTPDPGDFFAVQDLCSRPGSVFFRIGIAGGLGDPGYGWMPGMGHFSGDQFMSGRVGPQNGDAIGGTGKDDGGLKYGFPHGIWGLGANVKQDTYVLSEDLYPASSAMLASCERQAVSSPGCFLVRPFVIRALWGQWMDGMRVLADRLVWERGSLPGSVERSFFHNWGPGVRKSDFDPYGQKLPNPGSWPGAPNRSTYQLRNNQAAPTSDVITIAHNYCGQASAWRVKKGGKTLVSSYLTGQIPDAGSAARMIPGSPEWWVRIWAKDGPMPIQWLDGDPFESGPLDYWPNMLIPDRIYRFKDPTGVLTDKGTIGEWGPVDEIAINPWCDDVRAMQMWALKTLQCAYVTQYAPAFRDIDPQNTLELELRNRREQLLTHEARFKIETRDVLDSVGPDSYLALLKSSGVGKMGAGSLTWAPGGAELDPGHPAAPEPQLAAPESSGGGAWKKQAKGLGFAATNTVGPPSNTAAIAAAGALAAWFMLRR